MKLHVMSDLHLDHLNESGREEFYNKLSKQVIYDNPDVAVLAGDISAGLLKVLSRFELMYKKILYIGGNHDFWGTFSKDYLKLLKNAESDKIKILNPGSLVNVNGVSFTGGTLWFPDPKDEWEMSGWIDYRRVYDGDKEINNQHQNFVNNMVKADVVVSHHFPNSESIGPNWIGDPYNKFFSAEIDDKLNQWKQEDKLPKLWIHGHTHDPFDYVSKHGYRTYCNPYGYAHERSEKLYLNKGFWDRLLVDI